MATGFEKFASKTLKEEPIALDGKAKQPEIVRPAAPVAQRASRTAEPAPQPVAAPVAPVVEEPKEEVITMTLQVSKEVRAIMDEFKYRQKRSYRALVEEAMNDLKAKYNL